MSYVTLGFYTYMVDTARILCNNSLIKSDDGGVAMKINHETGIIFDAFAYATNYFNMDKVRTFHKTFVKNEDDIFENYYDFKKALGIEPSENIYLFFIYNPIKPNVIMRYLFKLFPDYNITILSMFEEINNKDKLKRFVHRHILEPYKSEVNIEGVIKGDLESVATAIALLSSDYREYPLLVKALFCDFDELVDELITYLQFIIPRLAQFYRVERKNTFKGVIADFIKSEIAEEVQNKFLISKKLNLKKQTFAVSFFRSFVVAAPDDRHLSKASTILIGDKSNKLTGWYSNFRHITKESVASIFTHKIKNDIIDQLVNNGEMTVVQLNEITLYDISEIIQCIKMLQDEKVVEITRKDEDGFVYKINYPYFRAALPIMKKVFDDILEKDN